MDAQLSLEEEEVLFEEWLAKGIGRIRLVSPPTHSSYEISSSVVLNIGIHGLVDGADLMNTSIDEIPFQVAPLRETIHRGINFSALDIVVNHKTVAADNCIQYLRQLVFRIASTAAIEYPSLYKNKPQYGIDEIKRLEPMEIAPLTLEITNSHFKKGFKVMHRAHAQQLRHERNTKIKPLKTRDIFIQDNALYPSNELFVKWDSDGTVSVVSNSGLLLTTTNVDCSIKPEQCKAFIIKKLSKIYSIRIKIYKDEIDARAVDLQNKMRSARGKRVKST